MSQKIYIVTKDKYNGHQRTLGFFTFLNNDLYYDFGALKGSHNSYHKDGSEWRTSLATGSKPQKQGSHIPLASFSGHHNLGVVMLSKSLIPKFSKVKQKYFNKFTAYEIDVESFTSNQFNIVIELVEPDYVIPLTDEEKSPPLGAIVKEFKETTPWLVLTILGEPDNLLVSATDKETHVNHFNTRYTANAKGSSYSSELYAGKAYDVFGKET